MQTKEQVRVMGDFPKELWDDVPARETAWDMLRERAAQTAATRPGWVLTDDPGQRSAPMYMKIVDGANGEPALVETDKEHAEFVRLQLATWATRSS